MSFDQASFGVTTSVACFHLKYSAADIFYKQQHVYNTKKLLINSLES